MKEGRHLQKEKFSQLVRRMADVFSARKRSQIMSRVLGRGNKATELALIVLLRRHQITGWRRAARLFGKPDFVFPKHRLAVFVDGCFWHGCQSTQHSLQATEYFGEESSFGTRLAIAWLRTS